VAIGRDPREIATIYNVPGRITILPLPATRDDSGRWIGGSVEQWVDELTTAVREAVRQARSPAPAPRGRSDE
jgi:hypothetical protein